MNCLYRVAGEQCGGGCCQGGDDVRLFEQWWLEAGRARWLLSGVWWPCVRLPLRTADLRELQRSAI